MKITKGILSSLRPQFRRHYLRVRVKCHRTVRIFHPDRLKLGRYIYVGPNCMLNAQGEISIGDGTILGPEVVVLSSSHDFRSGELLPYDIYDVERPVEIGRGVWIGYRAMIAPGVTIGDGAVVAMGAVVVKDIAPGGIVGGNPAQQIASRDVEEIDSCVEHRAFFHKRYWSGNRPRETSKRPRC